jgi:hypothetical protein
MSIAYRTAHAVVFTGGNGVLKRLLFFTYGVASYLVFLAAFLWLPLYLAVFVPPLSSGAAPPSVYVRPVARPKRWDIHDWYKGGWHESL